MAIIETNISSQDGSPLTRLFLASARWIPSCEGREPLPRQTLGFVFFTLHFTVAFSTPPRVSVATFCLADCPSSEAGRHPAAAQEREGIVSLILQI